MAVTGAIVKLGAEGFQVNGSQKPLIAAEFEYFRHDATHWERILEGIRESGIDIISSFIAWDFHEVEKGRFDLAGATHPSRDLVGFLELCREWDFKVFARPGPFIDAEWETRGPAPDVMHLDRLHPRFLERTSQWVNAVGEVLVPAQVTKGGVVAAVALDNQITYPWSTSDELHSLDGDVQLPYDADYHDNAFREWLAERYSSLADMNAACQTNFLSWEAVRAPRFADDPAVYSHEGFHFIDAQVKEYLERLQAMFVETGIEVPTYTNQFQFLGYIEWSQTSVNSVGMDLFMPDRMPGDQALVANWWLRLHFARFEFRWAAEFQAGWIGLFEEYGFLSPEHSEYMPMAAQAAGLRGLSFFLYVEREDWAHSPMNALGKIRPERYERTARVVSSYRGLNQLDSQMADVGLIWSSHDHAATYLGRDPDWSKIYEHCGAGPGTLEEAKEAPVWWETFRALVDADIDFRFWIPGVSPGSAPKILVHAGLPFAPAEHVANLARIMSDRTSTIVEVTPLPMYDLRGESTSAHEDALEQIHARGSLVPALAPNLPLVLAHCGAKSYVRTNQTGVWSYVHRDEAGATILGVWNSSDRDYDGRLELSVEALTSATKYLVTEPRLDSTKEQCASDVYRFPMKLDRHSARVFRIVPAT